MPTTIQTSDGPISIHVTNGEVARHDSLWERALIVIAGLVETRPQRYRLRDLPQCTLEGYDGFVRSITVLFMSESGRSPDCP